MTAKTRNAIGPYIRELRMERALTLDELANRIGISASHLSRIERGLTSPSFRTVAGLARELGVTGEELVQEQRKQVASDDRLVSALRQAGMQEHAAMRVRNGISAGARLELLTVLERLD